MIPVFRAYTCSTGQQQCLLLLITTRDGSLGHLEYWLMIIQETTSALVSLTPVFEHLKQKLC